ncbi:hypothetical protein EDC96DRAFT_609266 [Choanephora cucurbitarum]|nr:hypothetical protein EDC96DRAFT_609266 [Choanephora cucurbitarum]
MESLLCKNSLTELHHNRYDSFYMDRNIVLRINHILHLLTKVSTADYCQDDLKAYHSSQKAKLIATEEMKSLKAFEASFEIVRFMLAKIGEKLINCGVSQNCVNSYSCLNTTKPYRRTPLSLRLSSIEPASADLSNAEDSYDMEEAEGLRHAEHLESIGKYHSLFECVYQQK